MATLSPRLRHGAFRAQKTTQADSAGGFSGCMHCPLRQRITPTGEGITQLQRQECVAFALDRFYLGR